MAAGFSPIFMVFRNLVRVLLILLCLPTALAYTDTASYSWTKSIEYLTERGFVQGYPDDTFRPQARINRAEFTKIVIAARFELQEYVGFTASCFSDVPANQWFTPSICFAKSRGIIGGNPDGTFRPGNFVNQAEALKILLLTFEQKLEPVRGVWYQQYFDTAKIIGMLYFAGGDEASYSLHRGEMAYFAAWLLAHQEGKSVDQLMQIPMYVPAFSYKIDGKTHTVTMDANQVDMRVLTGNSSIRSKECDEPHHCVAEAQGESFDSMVARSQKGLVVTGAFFDAYSVPVDEKNFHQISSDIVIDGVMRSMYGWDAAFGNGGMLARLKDGTFTFFYPIREWRKAPVWSGFSNYPLVLDRGHIRSKEEIGTFAENDAKFWIAGRRGGLGLSQDGSKVIYASVDGTVAELANALMTAGAWNGFALDSGASNAMYLQGNTIFKAGRKLTTAVEFFER